MFSILTLLCLLFGFGVLLYTFVWIARLLARRAEAAEQGRDAEVAAEVAADEAVVEEGEEEEPSPEDQELAELKKKGGVMKTNATLGLILAIVACLVVSMGPLAFTLTLAAFYFCGQALWIGLRYFRVFIVRAAIGIMLAAGSTMLQYLALTGQLAELVPILS